MFYKNKAEAEKAANNFAIEMLKKGYYVSRGDYDDKIHISYGCSLDPASVSKHFEYHTLKKGDVCEVSLVGGEKTTRIFSGEYWQGKPFFVCWISEIGEKGELWSSYKKIGYNILTGEHDAE